MIASYHENDSQLQRDERYFVLVTSQFLATCRRPCTGAALSPLAFGYRGAISHDGD